MRDASYTAPPEFETFNEAFFLHAHVAYNRSNFESSDGFMFKNFTIEAEEQKFLENAWFPPLRTTQQDDFIILSNLALVPEGLAGLWAENYSTSDESPAQQLALP